MNWDGQDRRKNGQKDHDLLIKIHVIVAENAKNMDRFDVEFKDHVKSDNEQFLKFSRFMWLILGGFAAIEVGMKLWGLFK